MADYEHERFPVHSRNKSVETIVGSFDTNGSSSPAAAKGAGFSVARTGTGVYLITFDRPYKSYLSAQVALRLGTEATDSVVVGGPISNLGTSSKVTWRVTTFTSGSAADIAANADNRVEFAVTFKREQT